MKSFLLAALDSLRSLAPEKNELWPTEHRSCQQHWLGRQRQRSGRLSSFEHVFKAWSTEALRLSCEYARVALRSSPS